MLTSRAWRTSTAIRLQGGRYPQGHHRHPDGISRSGRPGSRHHCRGLREVPQGPPVYLGRDHQARHHEPRHELSRYAPKMFAHDDPYRQDQGRHRQAVARSSRTSALTRNCKIDVQEDGHVFVSAVDRRTQKARHLYYQDHCRPRDRCHLRRKVTRLMNFVRLLTHRVSEGLVHISKLDTKRVERGGWSPWATPSWSR